MSSRGLTTLQRFTDILGAASTALSAVVLQSHLEDSSRKRKWRAAAARKGALKPPYWKSTLPMKGPTMSPTLAQTSDRPITAWSSPGPLKHRAKRVFLKEG